MKFFKWIKGLFQHDLTLDEIRSDTHIDPSDNIGHMLGVVKSEMRTKHQVTFYEEEWPLMQHVAWRRAASKSLRTRGYCVLYYSPDSFDGWMMHITKPA